jgi:hypothetical protein
VHAWGSAAAGRQEDRGLVSMHDPKPEKGVTSISAKSLSSFLVMPSYIYDGQINPAGTLLYPATANHAGSDS